MAERKRKLGERILRYIKQPKLFLNYARYIFDELCDRWPKKEISIYVLEMKIPSAVGQKTPPEVKRITSLDPLIEFIRSREEEDSIWHGNYLNEVKRRFVKGDICFAAIEKDCVVSTMFVTFGGQYFAQLHYYLRFPGKVAGFIDSYTMEAHRGRGYYKIIFTDLVSYLSESEFANLYGFIAPDNKVSLITHNRLGLNHIIMKVSMHQRWGFRWHSIKKLDTYIEKIL